MQCYAKVYAGANGIHVLIKYCTFVDGLVSHVCAVNPTNGCTALHLTIDKGDNPKIVSLLLDADSTCVNMQDNKGLTPLHYACRQKRKKCVDMLLVRAFSVKVIWEGETPSYYFFYCC